MVNQIWKTATENEMETDGTKRDLENQMTEPQRPETCPTCNRYTEHGKQQLALESRSRPIYGTDFSKPLSVLMEVIRSQIRQARGQLRDISYSYPGWKEHVDHIDGLLTCGLIALHHAKKEMAEHEKRYARPTPVEATGLSQAEMKAQASRCGCKGTDEYCVCQNVPDRVTLDGREGGSGA